jgi:plasmid stabilization system protein ParE
MTLRIQFTRKAAIDIAQNYAWTADQVSETAARRWRDGLESAIRKLTTSAWRCPEAPEAEWLGSDIRQLLHGRRKSVFRILFRIHGDTVEILRVRHARQDLLGPDDW